MPEYTALKVSKSNGLATITIDHGKVNAIDAELSRDLESAFLDLGGDDYVLGVVLAGKPHCFCAGLNVMTMAKADQEGLQEFFATYLAALKTMVRFDKPLVAAVTGFAPAAGTILALTADYRVMAQGKKHTMGMNEFNMSLQIPRMMGDIFAYYLGQPQAWTNVQRASMYTSDEALARGLVDESVDQEAVLERATAHCRKMMQVHPVVFRRTKRYLRSGLLAVVDRGVDEMLDTIAEDFNDPVFKQMMDTFVSSLK